MFNVPYTSPVYTDPQCGIPFPQGDGEPLKEVTGRTEGGIPSRCPLRNRTSEQCFYKGSHVRVPLATNSPTTFPVTRPRALRATASAN